MSNPPPVTSVSARRSRPARATRTGLSTDPGRAQGRAGLLQAPPRRPLGARAPALARRTHRLLAPARRAGEAWLLRGRDHGTQVVLLGRRKRHDTIQAPDSVTDGRRQWITRYLNGRFVQLPARTRARAPRPRTATAATAHPRRGAPPPASRDCGRSHVPQRRDRPLVGAR